MDINQIVSLIGSLGFPIVCVFVMLYLFKSIVENLETSHKEEMSTLRESLDNNTKAIQSLREEVMNRNGEK